LSAVRRRAFRGNPLVEGQVQERDGERAGEKHEEEAEEQPAEADVLPGELWIHQAASILTSTV